MKIFGIPRKCLPRIASSAEIYGRVSDEYGSFAGVPISGMLGDQQASLVGNGCIEMGTAKITYGTGCFLLYNTGETPVFDQNGLITTVAYKLGKRAPTCYAFEGSVATCGFAVQWLEDIFGRDQRISETASDAKTSGGVYFVPAFSGLFCPYWKADARGCFMGLTGYTTRAHMARAVLEGIAFQAMDVLNCVETPLTEVKVDGGLARADLLLQFQADILGIPVKRGTDVESTSRGAAIAAAYGVGLLGAGIISSKDECCVFNPKLGLDEREKKQRMWKKAVLRSMEWVEPGMEDEQGEQAVE
jgi:glycerol kinase